MFVPVRLLVSVIQTSPTLEELIRNTPAAGCARASGGGAPARARAGHGDGRPRSDVRGGRQDGVPADGRVPF